MAKDKYDFIQELLENKKLQPAHRERVLMLTKEEIKKEGIASKDLEERVKKLEEMINISSEKIPTITKTQSITSQSEKIPKINHDPITIYKLLSSFKTSNPDITEEGFINFKYLLHGYEQITLDEYKEKINKAREDFSKLKNIPYQLYKNLDAIIYTHENYGSKIVEDKNIHPFDEEEEIIINEQDCKKLSVLFGGGKPFKDNHYKKIRTAIQNFKKKYRFDVLDESEASILRDFLENVIKYQKYASEKNELSFSDEGEKFNYNQLIFNLQEVAFFGWNPSVKAMIKWIFEGILKHSNINGNREFNPLDKKIIVSTKTDSDELTGYEYVILEIHDTKSVVLKKPEDFVNYVLSACNESNLNSVCDFSVNFMDKDHNNYECSILPKNNIPSKITIDNDGLIYKFKFLKNLE